MAIFSTKICMDPSQKRKEKNPSCRLCLLACKELVAWLIGRCSFYHVFQPWKLRQLHFQDAYLMVTRRHTESLAACPDNKDRPTSFHFISFHREVITEKKQIVWIIQTRVILENIIGHFTRSLGGFAPLLQVHLIYSKNAKVYYSYTTTLWRHDINMRWDANMLLTSAFSRKQNIYSELNGWWMKIKILNALPPGSCAGLGFRLCKLQCMHHVETGESPVKHDKDFHTTGFSRVK